MFQIHFHDIAILARDGRPILPASEVALLTHELHDAPSILQAHAALAYRIPERRLQQRLRNGLRFMRFDVGVVPVATTWLASCGGRYIDELNWLLPMAPGEAWVRDVFIAPAWRGKRLFSHIAAALAQHGGGPAQRVWSDVDWVNVQSMHAHAAAGFHIVARLRALDLRGRLRLRSSLPPWPLPVAEIDPASRWVWLRGATLQRHRELVA